MFLTFRDEPFTALTVRCYVLVPHVLGVIVFFENI